MKRVVRVFLQNEEGKYLLVRHHKKGNRALPGGHIEKGESIYQAIKREIKEELGLDIKIIGQKVGLEYEQVKEQALPLCIYTIKYLNRDGKNTKKLEYVFLAKIKKGKIVLEEKEIFEYNFFTKEEIIKDDTVYTQTKEIAQKLL